MHVSIELSLLWCYAVSACEWSKGWLFTGWNGIASQKALTPSNSTLTTSHLACMYLFTVVKCTAWIRHNRQSEGAEHNNETNAAYVDSDTCGHAFFLYLHRAQNTTMLHNQHAAKYIWQSTQCMHLSVFLHHWAEEKVNKLSLRSVSHIKTPLAYFTLSC
jgi:hypothetical protein